MRTFAFVATLIAMASALSEAGEREDFVERHKEEFKAVTERLERFHAALTRYMEKHKGVWPQIPENDMEDEESFARWWKKTLQPYGMAAADWDWKGADTPMAFSPTPFSGEPLKAFEWQHQPWIMTDIWYEKEGVIVILFPEGTIHLMPFDEHLHPKFDDSEATKERFRRADKGPSSRTPESLQRFEEKEEKAPADRKKKGE